MKKCFEMMKRMMTLCMLLFLTGCSEKETLSVEEPVSVKEVQIMDTLHTYGSERELQVAQTKRLAQKLVCEGQIKNENELYFVEACQRNISYNYAYLHNYAYKDESALDVCYPYELYHISLSEEGEITYYYTLLDFYVSTLDSGASVICAGNEQDEVIREVTDLSTALKQESPYTFECKGIYGYIYGDKRMKLEIDPIRVLKKQWSTEKQERLQDPVTAAEELLLLRGGKGERIDSEICPWECMVKYQFANGEEITYDMVMYDDYWIPMFCWEKDDELYPELKGITEEYKRYDMIGSLAEKRIVTMDDFNNALSGGILEAESYFVGFGIINCGNIQFFTNWDDFYRMDDVHVPIDDPFDSSLETQSDCIDCDGDGQEEYVLTIGHWSTRTYVEDLYIFDIVNDHLNIRLFEYRDMSIEPIESLLSKICFEVYDVDYEIKEGQIYLEMNGGFPPGECRYPDCWNEYRMGELQAKLEYHEDGSYEFTELQFDVYDDVRISMEKEEALYQYSANELRKVNKHYKGEQTQDTQTPNFDVVIIAEDSKADAAMYGISDERRDVTVLRVKDKIYHLHLHDWSCDDNLQRVLSGYDYDGDGELEYLYYTVGEDGNSYPLYMFEIVNGKVEIKESPYGYDLSELENLMAEKYEHSDWSDICYNVYMISLKDHSIQCVHTVYKYTNIHEKAIIALIQSDVKYGADGTFSFENPVLTTLMEE